ncbi:hypothetical protein KAU37_07835 [Candidatus Bipolaricaulota bacterium]|nr:hypothetical protein [Candidatus Bipolaricaulota bacterium]
MTNPRDRLGRQAPLREGVAFGKSGDITPISAWSDLHSWHPQEERFDAGDEKRDLGTIVGRDDSTIDLIGKVVANRLNNKSEGPSSPLRTACLFARPYFPERGREPTEQGPKETLRSADRSGELAAARRR